jgi:hypothetical protein
MFLIEYLFHLSPDQGSGLTELAILMAVVSGLLVARVLRASIRTSDQ